MGRKWTSSPCSSKSRWSTHDEVPGDKRRSTEPLLEFHRSTKRTRVCFVRQPSHTFRQTQAVALLCHEDRSTDSCVVMATRIDW